MKKFWMIIMMTVAAMAISVSASAQPGRTITGTVTNEYGDPLFGVYVIENGTNENATTTDGYGRYSITLTLPNAALTFKYLGMKTVAVAVENKTVINVVMEPDYGPLGKSVAGGRKN